MKQTSGDKKKDKRTERKLAKKGMGDEGGCKEMREESSKKWEDENGWRAGGAEEGWKGRRKKGKEEMR